MSVSFLSTNFPSQDVTDGDYLYRSLGSFWTKIFQDKQALRGYTIGMAEELIQAYLKLTEVVRQYSVKEIDVLHKEKWQPLIIKKSQFNKAPFRFESDGAVFGRQPDSDPFYPNTLFRFGYPKETDKNALFSFTPTFKMGKLAAIANRIIAPSIFLVPGVDILLQDNTLYFNLDIFNSGYIPKSQIIDDQGNPALFKDNDGLTYQDELVVLWIYNAELDNQELYRNFGILFDLKLPSSEAYKELLKALMNLAVEGSSVTALNVIFSAIASAPIVIDPVERVEQLYEDDSHKYVITDKNVYRISAVREIPARVEVGATLRGGTALSSEVQVMDLVNNPNWWLTEVESNKLGFPDYVFAADIKYQLFFENVNTYISYKNDSLFFPVHGREQDIAAFQAYINQADNKSKIITQLGLETNTDARISINPIDFIFSNLLKNNSLFLKLALDSPAEINHFFNLLSTIRSYMPAHVYLLVYITLKLQEEALSTINHKLTIPGFDAQLFSIDGSVTSSGARPSLGLDDDAYYKDYENRLFCISVGPYRQESPGDSPKPLHDPVNLDSLTINSSLGIKAGTLRTYIPEYVRVPGEENEYRNPTTKDVPAILLIDF